MDVRTMELSVIPELWSRAEAEGWSRACGVLRRPVVDAVALDEHGSRLVAAGAGHLFAYDLGTGRELERSALGDGSEGVWAMVWVYSVALTADGARIVAGETRYTESRYDSPEFCSIHDARTLARERSFALDGLSAFAASPDGEHLALTAPGGKLQVMRATTGQVIAERSSPGDAVAGLVFSSDGRRLGVAWDVCAISVLEVPTGRVLCESDSVETNGEIALGFSADGERLLVASDSNLRHESVTAIVDVPSGKLRRRARFSGALRPLYVDGARAEVLWREHALPGRTGPNWLYRQALKPGTPLVPVSLPPVEAASVTAAAVSGDGARVAIAVGTTVTVATIGR